jgi:hypothetical protein
MRNPLESRICRTASAESPSTRQRRQILAATGCRFVSRSFAMGWGKSLPVPPAVFVSPHPARKAAPASTNPRSLFIRRTEEWYQLEVHLDDLFERSVVGRRIREKIQAKLPKLFVQPLQPVLADRQRD